MIQKLVKGAQLRQFLALRQKENQAERKKPTIDGEDQGNQRELVQGGQYMRRPFKEKVQPGEPTKDDHVKINKSIRNSFFDTEIAMIHQCKAQAFFNTQFYLNAPKEKPQFDTRGHS